MSLAKRGSSSIFFEQFVCLFQFMSGHFPHSNEESITNLSVHALSVHYRERWAIRRSQSRRRCKPQGDHTVAVSKLIPDAYHVGATVAGPALLERFPADPAVSPTLSSLTTSCLRAGLSPRPCAIPGVPGNGRPSNIVTSSSSFTVPTRGIALSGSGISRP
ncbi:hypothetical protein LZ30DRAFT_108472 [Colletotrichum cereale]|nr:hypothetical protein LZ30DRAFT_108472 [Colletotrichum cereale]